MNQKIYSHLVYFPCKLFVSVAASIWPSLQDMIIVGVRFFGVFLHAYMCILALLAFLSS